MRWKQVFFEQGEHTNGCSHFQRGGERAHVGIADQQMESTIFSIICQRFIASVDNRPVELHPLINVIHNMIGSLADLKIDVPGSIGEFEIESERICLSNPAGARENLPGG